MAKKQEREIEISGNKLICPICKHTHFFVRKTLMNTAVMTALRLDCFNKEATNYICANCRFILWFLDK